MPHISTMVTSDALHQEVAELEAKRNILKMPEEIERLQKAKKSLVTKLKELQTQYVPEQERLEELIDEAHAELAKVTSELNTQKDAIPEVMATLESQKKAADEYLTKVSAQTEAKLKELNDRRSTCAHDVVIMYQGLKDKEQAVEVKVKSLEQQERAVIEKEKALALQVALFNESRAREQKFNAEQEAALKLEYDKLNVRKDVLTDREKAIAEREGLVLVQEAGLSNLKSELDLREQKVIQDRLDMAPKWDEILKREADLETNWKVYVKAKRKLDLKLKELEG
ncbi:MAG: hypothetical protein V1753_12620 [Pseudomonadota bacterium]